MTLLDRFSRWSGAFSTLLLPLLLLVPALFLDVLVADTFKTTPEVLILLGGGLMVLVVGIGRALGGLPALGGGTGSRARWLMAGLTLWVGVTSVFAFNARMAWIYAATFITYMLVGQSVLDWLEEGRERRRLLIASLGGLALIQTLIGATQLLRLPYRAWAEHVPGGSWLHSFLISLTAGAETGTAIGTMGNPNYLAECLVLLWPVLFGAALVIKSRWLKVTMFGILVLIAGVLLGTSARAAAGGLILSGLVAVWLVWGAETIAYLRQGWASARGRLAFGCAAVAMVVVFAVAGGPIVSKFQRLGTSDESIGSRLVNWQVAVAMIGDRPIQGAGIGNYKALNTAKLAETHSEGIPLAATKTRFAQAHNEPLQALVELGLVGGLLLLGALVFWVRETISNESLSKPLQFGLVWGVGALLASGLFGFPLHIPVTALALMTVLALGLAGSRPVLAPVLPTPWRVVYTAVVAVLLGTLLWQVAVKDALPLYAGGRYQDLGEKLTKLDGGETTLTVLSLAERTQRYRVEVIEKKIRALVNAEKFDEAVALYDGSQREGLGLGSLYWKGRALQKLGRKQEAYAAFSQLATLFPEGTDYNKRSSRHMRRLKKELDLEGAAPQRLKEGH